MFYTRRSEKVPGLSSSSWHALADALSANYFISPVQIAESASFSMAMVVRHALGAYAARSNVVALVSDSLSGAIAAATVRHLLNGGASATLLSTSQSSTFSPVAKQQVETLKAMKVPVIELSATNRAQDIDKCLAESHLIISGLFTASNQTSLELNSLIEQLQEITTPIHSIQLPFGIDPDTGKGSALQLFSASTLSLGVPLMGLGSAQEAVGRHYLCDICIPGALLQSQQMELAPIFSEQPVIQIFREESTK